MKIQRAGAESEHRCENCVYFHQHYVKVPFVDKKYNETDDGYCIRFRRKIVRTYHICNEYKEMPQK